VLDAGPDILNHNTETVAASLPAWLDRAGAYSRTLELLDSLPPAMRLAFQRKTGIMVGLGEGARRSWSATFKDLRDGRLRPS